MKTTREPPVLAWLRRRCHCCPVLRLLRRKTVQHRSVWPWRRMRRPPGWWQQQKNPTK